MQNPKYLKLAYCGSFNSKHKNKKRVKKITAVIIILILVTTGIIVLKNNHLLPNFLTIFK